MKDLGETNAIRGVKIRITKNDFSFCQSHDIAKLLKRFNNFDVTLVRHTL